MTINVTQSPYTEHLNAFLHLHKSTLTLFFCTITSTTGWSEICSERTNEMRAHSFYSSRKSLCASTSVWWHASDESQRETKWERPLIKNEKKNATNSYGFNMRNNPHMQWNVAVKTNSLSKWKKNLFMPHSSDVIDEQTERVAALLVNCCQYANQISAKMHKRATSQRSENCVDWTISQAMIFMSDAFFRMSLSLPFFIQFGTCSCCDSMSSFFYWRFIWLLSELCR